MNECIFCKIINKEIETKIIAETDKSICFMDTYPVADGHLLVIPKKHFQNFSSCDNDYLTDVILLAKKCANVINDSKLKNWGMNILSNEGDIAGQKVFHFHLHIVPKYEKKLGLNFKAERDNNKTIDEVFTILKKSL